jgi:hypothetical protein
VTIDALSDNVLLEIFKIYVDETQNTIYLRGPIGDDSWFTLVHVCHRWRCLVFASPRYVGLNLLCTNRRPVKEMLDNWPAFPIAIQTFGSRSPYQGTENIIAALDQHDRVSKIMFHCIPNSLFEEFASMRRPFPELTTLQLTTDNMHQ